MTFWEMYEADVMATCQTAARLEGVTFIRARIAKMYKIADFAYMSRENGIVVPYAFSVRLTTPEELRGQIAVESFKAITKKNLQAVRKGAILEA